MIEREFIKQNIKEFQIQEFIAKRLKRAGHSSTKVQRTPLGEKIIISASRPGIIVGRKGENINQLTQDLKDKFKLENPQIEINEVKEVNLDAQIVAERIASALENFGPQRFKGVMHKSMADIMGAGALGVEILISGKIPSARARRWRVFQGYMKKCGDIAIEGVRKSYSSAKLKSGVVGIQVRIMTKDVQLPDKVVLTEELQVVEEIIEEEPSKKEEKKEISKKESDKTKEKKEKPKKETKKTTKKAAKKTTKSSSKKK